MIFGEYYPNPGSQAVVSLPLAIGAEALGTFLLVLMIFALTEGCNVAGRRCPGTGTYRFNGDEPAMKAKTDAAKCCDDENGGCLPR